MAFAEIEFKKLLKSKHHSFQSSCFLELAENDFVGLYGGSGQGKTTILNIISGLSDPDNGEIKINSRLWYSSKKKINLKPWKRDISYLFQDYQIFENMSVRKNIEFVSGKNNRAFIDYILEIFGLSKYETSCSSILSGGQKQRLALARCIAKRPKILLLDEPFNALDFETKSFVTNMLFKIHKNFGTTIIMVSHNLNEIVNLCSKIAIVKNGRVEEVKYLDNSLLINEFKTKKCRLKQCLNL